MIRYRVRKGLFGKCILQRWSCFPSGIPSELAGTCNWIDVNYNKAPAALRRESKCHSRQYGDITVCYCGNTWDTNDINPPVCSESYTCLEEIITKAIAGIYIDNDYGSSALEDLTSDNLPAVTEITKEIIKALKGATK